MLENWTTWIGVSGLGVAEFRNASVRILDVENQDHRRLYQQCKQQNVLIERPGIRERRMKEHRVKSTRQRLGRPPKPRDEVRSERVVSFVTRSEFDVLTELAEVRDESVSAIVHRILRSELRKEKPQNRG
jgi:hypothetical protein